MNFCNHIILPEKNDGKIEVPGRKEEWAAMVTKHAVDIHEVLVVHQSPVRMTSFFNIIYPEYSMFVDKTYRYYIFGSRPKQPAPENYFKEDDVSDVILDTSLSVDDKSHSIEPKPLVINPEASSSTRKGIKEYHELIAFTIEFVDSRPAETPKVMESKTRLLQHLRDPHCSRSKLAVYIRSWAICFWGVIKAGAQTDHIQEWECLLAELERHSVLQEYEKRQIMRSFC